MPSVARLCDNGLNLERSTCQDRIFRNLDDADMSEELLDPLKEEIHALLLETQKLQLELKHEMIERRRMQLQIDELVTDRKNILIKGIMLLGAVVMALGSYIWVRNIG